ncbi:thioredoxin family protein [Balneatrix alpica]|uniref:thioredoxin family protein n=1 Tax=Balneatrix alpica TaxID=75684 RepID=UPI002738F4B7|nr:co-chaperone YbbN [Balneatrix alpica]
MNDQAKPYIVEVSLDNIRDLIEQSFQVPILFDFWADWCAPCKALLPVLTKLAEEYQGRFILAKVDTEDQGLSPLVMQFGIRSLPTVYLFKDGQPVDGFNGALPESQVRALLEKHLPPTPEPEVSVAEVAQSAIANGAFEDAKTILNEALQQEPENWELFILLANACAQNGEAETAEQILQRLPVDQQNLASAKEVKARLAFSRLVGDAPELAVLEQQLAQDDSNSQARFWLATRLVLAGQYEGAMQQLLTLMKQDRQFQDDGARKTLIQLFDMLGNSHPLVATYRRKLYQALY